MSILDAYETEYNALCEEIQSNINNLKLYDSDDPKCRSLVNQIDALFSQSNDLIKQMEVEVGKLHLFSINKMYYRLSHIK